MTTPFIVFSLPRSRSAWLSQFLTYGDWNCSHDIATELHSIAALQDHFSKPFTGSSETGMIDGWRLVYKLCPTIKTVVVRRKVTEVAQSLAKFGLEADDLILKRNALLREVSALPNTVTVNYDDLNREETCKAIFEHCLQIPFDREHWLKLKDKNIQVDMALWLEKLRRNHDGIEALKAEVARVG